VSEPASSGNPYAAPSAPLAEAPLGGPSGDLIENGRRLTVGHGTRWIARGWELFKIAPGPWIGMWLIFVVIVIVANFIPLVGGVINLILQPLLIAGFMLALRAAENGEPVRVPTLFSGFANHSGSLALLGLLQFAAVLGVSILLGILVAVAIGGAASMGMLTKGSLPPGLLVPALLLGVLAFSLFALVAMANWFAPALVVLQGLGPIDALRMSFLACLRNLPAFLLYGLVMLLLAIGASLPVFLGWFVLGPLIFASVYAAFRDLFFEPA